MKGHIFLNFIFLVIREKDELYLSLESVTSIKKAIDSLKVIYHPVVSKSKVSIILLSGTTSKNLLSLSWNALSVSRWQEITKNGLLLLNVKSETL